MSWSQTPQDTFRGFVEFITQSSFGSTRKPTQYYVCGFNVMADQLNAETVHPVFILYVYLGARFAKQCSQIRLH